MYRFSQDSTQLLVNYLPAVLLKSTFVEIIPMMSYPTVLYLDKH